MKWKQGDIEGVVLKPIGQHQDDRGWLSEVFRSDEMSSAAMPVMGYVSLTFPGVTRGPHEHVEQADMFAFLGPGNFKLKMWDHREGSATLGNIQTLVVGVDNPMSVLVPPGVVHGYTNISDCDGLVLNLPDRLYAGRNKEDPVDEIRHEDDAPGRFNMDD